MIASVVAVLQGASEPPTRPQLAAVREAFDRELFDYPTARFSEVEGDAITLCGRVNAKNRMGAFTGWMRFAAVYRDGSVSLYVATSSDPMPVLYEAFCLGERRPVSRDYSRDLAHR